MANPNLIHYWWPTLTLSITDDLIHYWLPTLTLSIIDGQP